MRNTFIDNASNKINEAKEWIVSHPKKIFRYSIVLVFTSILFSVLQYIFFPPEIQNKMLLPNLFYESDKKIENKKAEKSIVEKKMKEIVEELNKYKILREQQSLTKVDSIRIEYLYNQYEKLKNGK